MKYRKGDHEIEQRLRGDAPAKPPLSRRFTASLVQRLDDVGRAPDGLPRTNARRRLVIGGLALAGAVGLSVVVWLPGGPAAPAEPSAAARALAEAVAISTRERPRRVATAVSRSGTPLTNERDKLYSDAQEIGRSLLAPLRSVVGG